jgi:hypothetical protein
MIVPSAREISDTNIFAGNLGGTRRSLVYEMKINIEEPAAMVLPVPTSPGTEIEFVDLSKFPTFFKTLDNLFPIWNTKAFSRRLSASLDYDTIKVETVGDFIASFVPTVRDFSRLDERFRLPVEIADQLAYGSFSYAVFQLSPEGQARQGDGYTGKYRDRFVAAPTSSHPVTQKVHPMAFIYETADDAEDTLFFPTVHVHDGRVNAFENFDHALYAGWSSGIGNFEKSGATKFPALEQAKGLVTDSMTFSRSKAFRGSMKNGDVVVVGATAHHDHFYNQRKQTKLYGNLFQG